MCACLCRRFFVKAGLINPRLYGHSRGLHSHSRPPMPLAAPHPSSLVSRTLLPSCCQQQQVLAVRADHLVSKKRRAKVPLGCSRARPAAASPPLAASNRFEHATGPCSALAARHSSASWWLPATWQLPAQSWAAKMAAYSVSALKSPVSTAPPAAEKSTHMRAVEAGLRSHYQVARARTP